MNDKIERIKQLTTTLNYHRKIYYNESKNEISDYEYDTMFDELKSLEDETGFILSNSPTQTVGYPVNSKFDKVTHIKPLLSLNKTQDINEFIKFCSVNPVLLMHKLDGLTIHIEYRNGTIYKAATRGDGITGDDITTNIKYFSNIPITVNNKDTFTVTGEAVIDRTTFDNINNSLPDNERFKNPRNLASGTVKQLDTSIVSSRNIKFLCWNANDLSTDGTMLNGLDNANALGFDTVTYYIPKTNLSESVPECIETLKNNTNNISIDGIVAMYNNISFGESLGKTSHHFNNGFAFKFYDEEEETVLTDIEWSLGKTGELCPVAIFNPVIIDGTTVTRASLHNITIVEELKLGIGDTIKIYKANQIIPQVRCSITKSNNISIPTTCPICNAPTKILINKSSDGRDIKTLHCTNNNCKGKLLGKLTHYVSKSAMNIDGLSEATIDKFISLGLISNILDIYSLKDRTDILYTLDGFGDTSINNLINSIEKSKTTTMERILNSLSIPMVGKTNAKTLANYINNDKDRVFELGTNDLTVTPGIGTEMNTAIHSWFSNSDNVEMLKTLLNIITIQIPVHTSSTKFVGLGFVITGKLNKYPNRDALQSVILHNGGTIQSSVSSNTNYLINNDVNSSSSKNKKAKELNIPIISEDDFLKLLGNDTSATQELTDNVISGTVKPTKTTLKTKKLF